MSLRKRLYGPDVYPFEHDLLSNDFKKFNMDFEMPEFEKMDQGQSDEEIYNYLSLLWRFARGKTLRLTYMKGVLEIEKSFGIYNKKEEEKQREQKPRLRPAAIHHR
ncbi:hypothetical protein TNCT_335781 [Trichonephila clavata]|uniref:Uncharacterized protein n=1 Tax=Trichonephila clavata TaxID=2740835 RepID=A0A8X6HJ05_TRICU|nr:hypothetical protein TNCT_335781 [Trichonephila clavata]